MVMGQVFTGLAYLVVLIGLVVPIGLWFGWAASIMWGWFIAPVFNLPPLSTLQCFAIILTVGAFHPKLNLQKSDPDEFWPATGGIILAPPITVGIGYVVKTWWM